ncbi:MAG: hypothetical protein IJ605_04695 [Prevotella sp.]|nr:hypothetical protein [Prevotella sp.]
MNLWLSGQTEENHLMENVIYNEMRHRGFLMDVGNVNVRVKNDKGQWQRTTLEVDFVCNLGSRRYNLQSAFRMPDEKNCGRTHETPSRRFRHHDDGDL